MLLCLRPFWCPLQVISTWPKSVTWPSPHFKKGAWGGGRRGSRMKDSIEKFGGRKIHSCCDKILQTESDSHRILSPEYVWNVRQSTFLIIFFMRCLGSAMNPKAEQLFLFPCAFIATFLAIEHHYQWTRMVCSCPRSQIQIHFDLGYVSGTGTKSVFFHLWNMAIDVCILHHFTHFSLTSHNFVYICMSNKQQTGMAQACSLDNW